MKQVLNSERAERPDFQYVVSLDSSISHHCESDCTYTVTVTDERGEESEETHYDICRCGTYDYAEVESFNQDDIAEHICELIADEFRVQAAQHTKKLRKQAKAKATKQGLKRAPTVKATKARKLTAEEQQAVLEAVNAMELSNESFEAVTCGGYYGEEIESVNLDSTTWSELRNKVREVVTV